MARKSDTASKIFIRVLWGDVSLGDYTHRFSNVGSVSVGRSFMSDVRSTVWPLRDDITLFERQSGKLYLNPDLAWNGIITTDDNVVVLDARKRKKKNLEIKSNSFATVRFEDISIAIRAGNDLRAYVEPKEKKGKYQASLLGLLADNAHEQAGLGVAVVMALLITGAIAGGLSKRDVWRPETIADVPKSMQLPFIAPSHFATAPEILQSKLDRFNFVDSVSSYYQDLATVMTRPNDVKPGSMMFEEVVSQYKRAASQQQETLSQMNASSERLSKELVERGGHVLAVPAVIGESLDGSMQRVLDKISIVSASAKELASVRAVTGDSFKGDPSYDYGAAAGQSGKDNLADFTKKLGDGFRSQLPDEEQQALEAKSLAIESSAAQVALFGEEHLQVGIHNCCDPLVGIKPGASPVTYTPTARFERSDEYLAALKASTWGAPAPETKKPKIVEPIVGVIDPKAVEKAISSGRFQLQLCFELALRRNQAAKGSMEWKWQIDSRGTISRLSLLKSTLKDDELVECVRTRIASWKFPHPKGGSVEIRYPFEFIRDKG